MPKPTLFDEVYSFITGFITDNAITILIFTLFINEERKEVLENHIKPLYRWARIKLKKCLKNVRLL